jgi:D-3-phosphoglycerate dehydrogenase
VQLARRVEELVAISDFVTIHATKTPDTIGLVNAEVLAKAKPGMRLINAGRAASSTSRRSPTRSATASSAAPRSTRSRRSPRPIAAVRARQRGRHPAPRRVDRRSAGQGGETIAEQVVLALRGDFVPFAVNVAASEASETVRPFLPLAERLGRSVLGLAGGALDRSRSSTKASSPTTTAGCSRLSILKGVLGPVVDEPVSFVNAPQLAQERGISVRETKSSDARDYVNLITVRGVAGRRRRSPARLFGKQQGPRIVGIDEHTLDLPPARHMLVVHNEDRPA